MRFFRIGDKVVSREKLLDEIDGILTDREGGATQLEVALSHNVQRSFVSILESLGEIRRGPKVALVAFPVANVAEVLELAQTRALDFVMVFSQDDRVTLEGSDATELFNQALETLAALRDFDVVVLMASDKRIATMEKILGREVVGIPLGESPLREAIHVDIVELAHVLDAVTAALIRPKDKTTASDAAADMLRKAAGAARASAGRWTASRK